MPAPAWVLYHWKLSNLPATAPTLEDCYQYSLAKPGDQEALDNVFTRAYLTEIGWSTDVDERIERTARIVRDRLSDATADFLAVRHGSRIIAASVVVDNPEAEEHFASGVCVLDEYRCRGLGTYLLYQSLERLRQAGLEEARALTKAGIAADKYLYGKFGGRREALSPAASGG
ncbi:MAG: GNAT family N-acetyltransferase [Verrucomicrobiota bacterium]